MGENQANAADEIAAKKAAALARKAAKTTAIDIKVEDRLSEFMAAGGVTSDSMQPILDWIVPLLPSQALGERCTCRQPADIKKIISDSTGAKNVQSGGSLSMINLYTMAFPRVSVAKVQFVLQSWDKMPMSLGGILGTIKVNADLWKDPDMKDLVRSSSDAEWRPQCCVCWFNYCLLALVKKKTRDSFDAPLS